MDGKFNDHDFRKAKGWAIQRNHEVYGLQYLRIAMQDESLAILEWSAVVDLKASSFKNAERFLKTVRGSSRGYFYGVPKRELKDVEIVLV